MHLLLGWKPIFFSFWHKILTLHSVNSIPFFCLTKFVGVWERRWLARISRDISQSPELESKNIEQQPASETNKIHSFFGIIAQKQQKTNCEFDLDLHCCGDLFLQKTGSFSACVCCCFVWLKCHVWEWILDKKKGCLISANFIAAQIAIKLKDCRCDFCHCFCFNSWRYCQEYFFVLFSCFFGFSFGLRLLKSKKKQRTNTLLMFWMGKNLSFTTNQKNTKLNHFLWRFIVRNCKGKPKITKNLFVLSQYITLLFFFANKASQFTKYLFVLHSLQRFEMKYSFELFLFCHYKKQSNNKTNWMQEEETKSKQTSFQLTWIILFLSLFCFSKINLSSYFLLTLFISFWIACFVFNSWQFVVQHFQIHLWGYFCSKKAFHSTKQNWKKLKCHPMSKEKENIAFLLHLLLRETIFAFVLTQKYPHIWTVLFGRKTKFGVLCWYFRQSVGLGHLVLGWSKQNQQWSLKTPGFARQTTWRSNRDYDWNWKYKERLINSNSVSQIKRKQDQGLWLLVLIFWVEKIRRSTIVTRFSKKNKLRKKKKRKEKDVLMNGQRCVQWKKYLTCNSKIFKKDWFEWVFGLGSTFTRTKKKEVFWNVNKIARKIRTRTNKKLNQSKHIFIFSLLNNQANNIEPNTQQKQQQKKTYTTTDRFSSSFFSFTFSSTKQPKSNKKTKKRNTVQIMSDTPCKFPKQITESAIKNQFQFLETVIEAIKFGDTTKALRLISDPKTNLEQTDCWVRNLVVVWFVLFCWIIVFVFVHSWGFFVSLFLFVVIEFVSVLLWTCIFVFVYFSVFSLFLLFFAFVGNCCYYFCSHRVETALHHACRILQQWTGHKGTFVQECQCELSRLRSQQHQNDISHKTLTLTQRKQTQDHLKNQNKQKKNEKKTEKSTEITEINIRKFNFGFSVWLVLFWVFFFLEFSVLCWTPLHVACRYKSIECTKLLLSAGADFEAKNKVLNQTSTRTSQTNKTTWTTFENELKSTSESSIFSVLLFFFFGFRFGFFLWNFQDGWTPLHFSLCHGSQLNVPNYFWMLVLIMKQRIKAWNKTNTRTSQTQEHQTEKQQKRSELKITEWNQKIRFFFFVGVFRVIETPLHFACYFKSIECTKLLLNAGADYEAKNEVWNKTNTGTSQTQTDQKRRNIKPKQKNELKITEIQSILLVVFFRFVFCWNLQDGWTPLHLGLSGFRINWMYQITFECWSWLWSKEWGMKQTTNKTKNQKKWNENKKKTKISKMWGNFCVKSKHYFFFTQEQMQEKFTLFSFSLIIGCYLSVFSFVLFGWKAVLAAEISAQMKKQQKCVVWLVSKQKRMVFHPMTKCKRKNPLCCPFFGLFCGDVWVSFFFVDWVNRLSWSQKYFHTCLKNTSKNKNSKTCQFSKDCWKRKVLAHCEKQQFLLWHKPKKEKCIFSIQLLLWETR